MKHLIITAIFALLSLFSLSANTVTVNTKFVHIIGSERQIKVEFIKKYIPKISLGYAKDTLSNEKYGVLLDPIPNAFKYKELPTQYLIENDSIKIYINKNDLKSTVIDPISGDSLMRGIEYNTPWLFNGFSCEIDSNPALYGMGSQAIDYNRTGTEFVLYNFSIFGYTYPNLALNIQIPFFVINNNFAVFVDNPARAHAGVYDKERKKLQFWAMGLKAVFYVINRKGQAEITKEFADMTGRQPLPPLWALGYLQSNIYHNTNEVINEVKKFKEHKLPLEAIIIDYNWFGGPQNIGNYEWGDSPEWENHQSLIDTLDKEHIKKVLIAEPYIAVKSKNYKFATENKYLVRNKESNIYICNLFYGEPAGLIDMTYPKAAEWFSSLYENISLRVNIAGWWMDIGEPELHSIDMIHHKGKVFDVHNLYSNIWSMNINKMMKKVFPNRRVFLLNRSAWAGGQQYSVFNWSSDCANDYPAMGIQPDMFLSTGLCGMSYLHSDIGGYVGSKTKNDRMYTRWMQFGAFSPLMRAHSNAEVPSQPHFYQDTTIAICRDFIELRYAMLPYIYTLSYENSTSGSPICRAMNYYENTERFKNTSSQYYFGRDILVAPIFDSTDARKVQFPSGKWINYFNLQKYAGNKDSIVNAPINEMPLFIRAGAIILNAKKIMNTEFYSTDTLILNHYYDKDIKEFAGYMYIDDGKNPRSLEDKQFEILKYKVNNYDSSIVYKIERNCNAWRDSLKNRVYRINIMSRDTIAGYVTLKQKGVDIQLHRDTNHFGGRAFFTPAIDGNCEIIVNKYKSKDDTLLVESRNSAMVFPNPITDEININIGEGNIQQYNLQIFNASGKMIFEINELQPLIINNVLTINLKAKFGANTLNSGAYFGKLIADGKSINFQFIKE